MDTHPSSPHSSRPLPLLLIVLAGLIATGCGEAARTPSSPSVVMTPTSQAEAPRSALASQRSPDFAGCLRHPDPSCRQSSSLDRASDGGPGATNLVATVSGTTVRLTWSPPSGVSLIDNMIDVRLAPGQPYLANYSVGVITSFTATDVPVGTYYVSVRAQYRGGNYASPSNEVAVTVTSEVPCVTPGAPSGLRASVEGSTVILNWTAASGSPLSYLLDVGSAPGRSDLASGRVLGNETSVSALNQPAGTYYVRVRATNGCGTGPASNEVVVTVTGGTCTTAPAAPTGLRASVSGSTITLNWTAPSGSPRSYLLDAGSAPGLSDLVSGREVGVDTTMSAPNQPAGTYYLRVRAVNNCGTGPASNEVRTTVAPT